MRSYGEKINNHNVVAKVLRSLTTKLENVFTPIEESKDLYIYSFSELMSSLIDREERLNRSSKNVQNKAFEVKWEFSYKVKEKHSVWRGYHRGNFCGKGRTGSDEGRNSIGKLYQYKRIIQCQYFKKFFLEEVYCWIKQKDEQKEANFNQKVEEENKFFIASSQIT